MANIFFRVNKNSSFINECIINPTYSPQISPHPSFPKRGIPPFGKGREGGI
jgi:hypothetical protein